MHVRYNVVNRTNSTDYMSKIPYFVVYYLTIQQPIMITKYSIEVKVIMEKLIGH